MEALGLDNIEFDDRTARPYEEQFWESFDILLELSEEELLRELPSIVIDPSNKAKVEALLAGRKKEAIGYEKSRQIEAATI